jgi:hypothetical protein
VDILGTKIELLLDQHNESGHVPSTFSCIEPTDLLATHEAIMRTYLITYDVDGNARHRLSSIIMQLGEAWARPLETTWYVQSRERPDALERRLQAHLDSEDGLLIQQVETDAVLLNTALRWFRKRRHDPSEAPNVVAFPVRELPEARAA